MGFLSRRQPLGALGGAAAVVAGRTLTGWAQASDPIVAGRPLVRYPQKTDLILLTSRPPQLETPMKWFDRAITPNEAFFVRYHVFPIPTRVEESDDVAPSRRRSRGSDARALDGRAQGEVRRGVGDRRQSVLGQQPRPLRATRARRSVG